MPKIAPRSDYCPATGEHVHSFIDMRYWGATAPQCAYCHYEDVTRPHAIGVAAEDNDPYVHGVLRRKSVTVKMNIEVK